MGFSGPWRLDYETPLLSINRERTMHWAPRAAYVQQVRRDAKLLARQAKIPVLGRAKFVVYFWQKRGPLADMGNHFPTAKAFCDGLVDAGIVKDDTPDLVTLELRAPRKATITGISVVVYAMPPLDVPLSQTEGAP
jgi:crossover junction endodeoxyribonuclease RusA